MGRSSKGACMFQIDKMFCWRVNELNWMKDTKGGSEEATMRPRTPMENLIMGSLWSHFSNLGSERKFFVFL